MLGFQKSVANKILNNKNDVYKQVTILVFIIVFQYVSNFKWLHDMLMCKQLF